MMAESHGLRHLQMRETGHDSGRMF
jgi:hypothetical protein